MKPKNRLKKRKIHTPPQHRLAELTVLRGKFVRVAGEPVGCEIERDNDPSRIDHLWITIRAGVFGSMRIAVNTISLRNRDLGFDSNVRVGTIPSSWNQLPAPGVFASDPVDYSNLETAQTVIFQEYARMALESLLVEKIDRSTFVEGWGELYVRGHTGIHEVHSRRASHAFKTDYVGRDGAVRLYFQEGRAEMLLFKFYGQP
jgi:hypothetical protein